MKRTVLIQPLKRYVIWENPLTSYETTCLERLRPNLSFWKTKMEQELPPKELLHKAIQSGQVSAGGWVELQVENGGWRFSDIWPDAMKLIKEKKALEL